MISLLTGSSVKLRYITYLCCALCTLSWLCDVDLSCQSLDLEISFPASVAESLLADSQVPLSLGKPFSTVPYDLLFPVRWETEKYFLGILGYESAGEELPLTCLKWSLIVVLAQQKSSRISGAQCVISHHIFQGMRRRNSLRCSHYHFFMFILVFFCNTITIQCLYVCAFHIHKSYLFSHCSCGHETTATNN